MVKTPNLKYRCLLIRYIFEMFLSVFTKVAGKHANHPCGMLYSSIFTICLTFGIITCTKCNVMTSIILKIISGSNMFYMPCHCQFLLHTSFLWQTNFWIELYLNKYFVWLNKTMVSTCSIYDFRNVNCIQVNAVMHFP